MAGTPDHVKKFLNNVNQRSLEQYRAETETLHRVRKAVEGIESGPINPWDVKYYTTVAKHNLFRGGSASETTAGYFSVEQSIVGMQILVNKLFGIVMEEASFTEGERWDGNCHRCGLRKFDFRKEEDGTHIGVVYLDLYPREGKYTHAAHFTIRCGCENNGTYQSPIVALVCNFSYPRDDMGVTILSNSEVETLFHEFGHALHSLLSHTTFQHLSGTRTSIDFIETPSHLMEHYVRNPEFLKLIGKHCVTGELLPSELINDLIQSYYAFRVTDVRSQVLLAQFDQTLFGLPDAWSGKSTTDVFATLHQENSVPYADGTHWHSRFGHLVTYGAGYYGYLYASVFAADLWKTCFLDGEKSLSRNAGMKYWKKMLVHGGAKDPNIMLKALLKRDPDVDPFFSSLVPKQFE